MECPLEAADLWGEEPPPPAAGRGAKGRQQKAEGKSKAKAKSKPKAKAKNTSLAPGMKLCRTCGEVQPLESFSDNAADDRACASIVAGLRRIAVQQNVLEWFVDEMSMPERRRRLCHNYSVRCPAREDAGPRGVFPLLQYQKEVFQERSLIKDTVFEFMDEPTYCAFMARPEKGNIKESKAKDMFIALLKDPNVIRDELGDTHEFKVRCAVKVKDMLISREAEGTREGFRLSEKEKKNATEEDVLKAIHQMENSNPGDGLPDQESIQVRAQKLANGGFGMGKPDDDAQVATDSRRVGELKRLLSDEDREMAAKKRRTCDDLQGSPPRSSHGQDTTPTKSSPSAQELVWFERESKIQEAQKLFNAWYKSQRDAMDQLICSGNATIECITQELSIYCSGDKKTLRNRLLAISLVRGGAAGLKAWMEHTNSLPASRQEDKPASVSVASAGQDQQDAAREFAQDQDLTGAMPEVPGVFQPADANGAVPNAAAEAPTVAAPKTPEPALAPAAAPQPGASPEEPAQPEAAPGSTDPVPEALAAEPAPPAEAPPAPGAAAAAGADETATSVSALGSAGPHIYIYIYIYIYIC